MVRFKLMYKFRALCVPCLCRVCLTIALMDRALCMPWHARAWPAITIHTRSATAHRAMHGPAAGSRSHVGSQERLYSGSWHASPPPAHNAPPHASGTPAAVLTLLLLSLLRTPAARRQASWQRRRRSVAAAERQQQRPGQQRQQRRQRALRLCQIQTLHGGWVVLSGTRRPWSVIKNVAAHLERSPGGPSMLLGLAESLSDHECAYQPQG